MEQEFRLRRVWLSALIAAFPVSVAAASPSSIIAKLPNVQVKTANVDASGNIYIAGQTIVTAAGPIAAYISKLSPDGTTTAYVVTLGGKGMSTTTPTALAVDSAGAVYVAGTTTATDFPVSPGAAQSAGATAFAAKLDAKGNVVYAALIGGNATTTPSSVVANSQGELVVSGQLQPNPQPSAVALFLLKLSADGTQVVAGPQGIGGLVTADAQDNIYVAGVAPSTSAQPASTPGAYQGLPTTYFCGCPFFGFACGGNQFVTSLTADLSKTRFLTYVTAKYGAQPAYIAVDAQGNVLIAGTTAAPGYPTTPDSFEPTYTAATSTVLTCGPPINMEVTSPSGYVTLVKADGSALIFSTFFSGSKTDNITFAALTSAGIYLAGQASSADLPGFDGTVASPCIPVNFVTRMSLDGSAISATRTPPGTALAYDPTNATILLISGSNLIRFDPSQDTPIACVVAAADLTAATAVAPGELLAMYGRFLYFESDPFAATIEPTNGSFPTQSQGLSVIANQTPAPLLYISEQQINLQVPYEIAGSQQMNLNLTYSDVNGNSVSDMRTLSVAPSNPVAFVNAPSNSDQTFPLTFPLALNADGTVNSQTNVAAAGSVVTIFLDGLGVTSPASITGLVNTSSPVPLNIPLTIATYCPSTFCYPAASIVSAASLPGSISGVTQVQLLTPANPRPGTAFQVIFSLVAGSTDVQDLNLSFWVK